MKKLHLNLDELVVDSFDTAEAPAEPGTVKGHDDDSADTEPSWCATCFTDCLPCSRAPYPC